VTVAFLRSAGEIYGRGGRHRTRKSGFRPTGAFKAAELRAGALGKHVSGDSAMALVHVDKHRGGQQRAFRNEAAFVSALFQLKGEGKCEATIANGNPG